MNLEIGSKYGTSKELNDVGFLSLVIPHAFVIFSQSAKPVYARKHTYVPVKLFFNHFCEQIFRLKHISLFPCRACKTLNVIMSLYMLNASHAHENVNSIECFKCEEAKTGFFFQALHVSESHHRRAGSAAAHRNVLTTALQSDVNNRFGLKCVRHLWIAYENAFSSQNFFKNVNRSLNIMLKVNVFQIHVLFRK